MASHLQFTRRTILTSVAGAAGIASSSQLFPSWAQGKKPVIGVTLLSLQYPFLVLLADVMKAEAAKKGFELVSLDPRQSVAKELDQVENLITRKVDVVVMIPVDQKESQNAARRVNEAGIPLVLLNTRFSSDFTASGGKLVAYVGSTDAECGEIQGKYLAEQMPDGASVIYLVTQYGGSATEGRKAGFYSAIKSHPNLKVVTELQGHGSRAEAKTIMENLLQKYKSGDVEAVVCQNDEMATGCYSAIEAAGRTGEFKQLIGGDGSQAGLDGVKSGHLTATVFQDAAAQGTEAINVAGLILSKGDIKAEDIIPFKLITKENVDSFLAAAK